jgi:2-polyprenyl-6-methoxyphenol hydroxylase-like FAD-dependent oxidoreductase
MKQIGIVGAGIAGLQLGLRLCQAKIGVTIYTEQRAEQLRGGRVANIVLRSAPTRERERQLGVAHWDGEAPEITHQRVWVNGPRPLAFEGAFDRPLTSVDLRMYTARLLEDVVARGAEVVYGTLRGPELPQLAERHDLLVVAGGRGGLSGLFARIPEHSPFSAPQRVVVGGLYRGIDPGPRPAVETFMTPGHGEVIAFPSLSFEAGLTAIGFETVTGGATATLRELRPGDDLASFSQTVLGLLEEFAPALAARCDRASFGLTRPLDLCHAAITPTVREATTRLPNGRLAVAIGDANVVIDPITGQGANMASHSAWVLGEAIMAAERFDEAFCRRVEAALQAYALPVAAAANARLRPPAPHTRAVLAAAAEHQPVADAYARGFNAPDQLWRKLERPETAAAFLDALGATPQPLVASDA